MGCSVKQNRKAIAIRVDPYEPSRETDLPMQCSPNSHRERHESSVNQYPRGSLARMLQQVLVYLCNNYVNASFHDAPLIYFTLIVK